MSIRTENKAYPARLDRELERERQQRLLNDEARLGVSTDLRAKDARRNIDGRDLTRQPRS
ncbi:hypothetical protein [Rugamonas sp.]|uniref:hypothetical protein n=1 Tax=Rugamonas sp. TaxID=1926287 RepID=UPI0025E81922|nr:hypothetical protein [Rugamonas sp.]